MHVQTINRRKTLTPLLSREIITPTLTNSLLSTIVECREELPLPEELGFLRDALSRFVCGGIYLFAGAPGGGKSLLACQIGLALGRQGIRSLFILTEQGPSNLKETAIRTTGDWDRATATSALANIQIEDRIYDVSTLPALVTRSVLNPAGQYHGVKLVVLDSIQGHGLAAAATKAYGKVLEASRLLAENGITVILVSHITKRGEVAGPKTLEHGVDAAIILRRAMQYTLLAVRKNRFGPPMLRMKPLKIDPVTTRLGLAPHTQALPGAAMTFAGAGSGLVQIQASVAVPSDGLLAGSPRRGCQRKRSSSWWIASLRSTSWMYLIWTTESNAACLAVAGIPPTLVCRCAWRSSVPTPARQSRASSVFGRSGLVSQGAGSAHRGAARVA